MSFLDQLYNGPSRQEPLIHELQESSLPTMVYGGGIYAYVLINYLRARDVQISKVVVDEAYKKEGSFLGLEVVTTESLMPALDAFNFVIGVTNYPKAQERLKSLGAIRSYVIDVPDFLNIPAPFMNRNFVDENADDLNTAFNLFSDELSRSTYIAAINAKLAEDVSVLLPVVRPDHLYFTTTEFPVGDHEVLLDVGGFDGDSIRDFVRITGGNFLHIISLEPFASSYQKLNKTIEELGIDRVETIQVGAWNEPTTLHFRKSELDIDNKITEEGDDSIQVDKIDAIVRNRPHPISLIKMDINGAESKALKGAAQTIVHDRPRIAVKMHVKEDFYRLPILLKSIAPEMKLYLRQRNYMSMMLVLYGGF